MKLRAFTLSLLAIAMIAGFSSCKNNQKKADTEVEQALPEGIQKYQDNGFTLVWLRDNAESQLNKVSLFPTAPEGLVEELGLTEGIPASMSTFLIQQDGKNILFDSGMGFTLIDKLAAIGVKPEDIDALYITHLHGDHIGGMTKEGVKVFPNAKLYLGRVEYEAWMAMEERNAQQKAALAPYLDNMQLFEFDETLPYDIKALDSVGHTPGHTCFLKGDVLIAGDIMHGVALQIEHPEINATYDMDPEKAAESRAKMIELAKSQKLLLCGMHFPDGGTVDFR